jgi:hypothetical protein
VEDLMAHQIIKQPDGRYLIWSTIVDDIIVYDADREEVVDYFAEVAARDARGTAGMMIDLVDEDPRRAYAQFTIPFEQVATRLDEVRQKYSKEESSED